MMARAARPPRPAPSPMASVLGPFEDELEAVVVDWDEGGRGLDVDPDWENGEAAEEVGEVEGEVVWKVDAKSAGEEVGEEGGDDDDIVDEEGARRVNEVIAGPTDPRIVGVVGRGVGEGAFDEACGELVTIFMPRYCFRLEFFHNILYTVRNTY